jgi:intracellular multiplication protein IcmL
MSNREFKMNESASTTNEDAVVLVQLRNQFYKKKYRFALGIYSLCLIAIVILISLLVYVAKNPTRPLYFLTDSVGRLMQEVPVTVPGMPTEVVAAWTVEAVEAAYSYNYVNYRAQLQDAQKYFTEYGWRNYMAGLTASNNLLAVTERKMIFVAKAVGPPRLVNEGILGGAYAWKFEVPLLVNFLEAPYDKATFSNAYSVTVVVQRQQLLQSYKGLAIIQMIAASPKA